MNKESGAKTYKANQGQKSRNQAKLSRAEREYNSRIVIEHKIENKQDKQNLQKYIKHKNGKYIENIY
ncbi:unnamed protein product [Paramecium pentaurelia]|uniref:Uncharacterized protein n=1 Tax=Paramecium pentaurelia TaxID=43138 RepID=A0A8S1SG16_9CILI|nr:unnamed protein product [Paramecium pentaurelia]